MVGLKIVFKYETNSTNINYVGLVVDKIKNGSIFTNKVVDVYVVEILGDETREGINYFSNPGSIKIVDPDNIKRIIRE